MREAETILERWGGLRFPLDKEWKKLAVVFVEQRAERLKEFMALGLEAIPDTERRELVLQHLGPMNGHDRDDYNFTGFLLDEAIGDRMASPRYIFMRCLGCYRIRTSRRMNKGPCKCGGTRMNCCVEPMPTQKLLKILATGC